MSSWKYNKVWCTKTNKFYIKEDLEKLTFEEFNDIREFFVCEYHNDVDINCQARMIARTKSVGRPKKPEEHFEIHCFATHKVDNHSRDCPYDYIKTIGSSYIVEDKMTDKENIKLLAILNKNVQENTNTEKALQKAKQTIHKPEINQNKVRNIGNTGVIGKRWRTHIASKVLNVDEMNSDINTANKKSYIFRENDVLIRINNRKYADGRCVIYLNVYKDNKKLYWIAMGYDKFDQIIESKKFDEISNTENWYGKIIKDERFKNLIYSEKWTGDISFLGRKSRSKKSKKVSFWIKDPDLFIFNQTN